MAYGFARFRFPGRNLLFTLLIATIFLPAAVTIIPTYTIFQKLGWVGTWLPLLVPTFFANAYDVFLMRQYFMTIPTRPGRGGRDRRRRAVPDALISVVLPQAWPVVIAVAIFHLVYSWNDFFGPLLYTAGKPDIQTARARAQRFNGIHYRDPGLIQAGTLMTLDHPGRGVPRCPSASSPGASSSPASRSEARSMACRVALTFDAEHPDRRHRPGGTERRPRHAGRGRDHGHVLRPGSLGRGVPGPRPVDRRPTATSSATTPTTMPACRC